jgi:very-short-patch-repair endonuclease
MGYPIDQSLRSRLWALAKRQHGVVARWQLIELGLHPQAIKHRSANGRLHRLRPGIYAVGRPQVSPPGHWLAAVLACGPQAVLSHRSAAALWQIRLPAPKLIEVSVPDHAPRRPAGVRVHRRASLTSDEMTVHNAIPVTTAACTLIDIATQIDSDQLEAAISEADKLDLISPEELRLVIDRTAPRPGVRAMRQVLDARTFRLTDSELERRFLRLVRRAGLRLPQTRTYVNGFKIDFYWPELRLVVETDGLRYHRTAAQQARDRVRDQALTAAGFTILRFTHFQIACEPGRVSETLVAVVRRLAASG